MSNLPALDSLFVPFRAERVLARRDGIWVVDKPPGIVVHGGDEKLGGDLVSRLATILRAEGHDGYLGVHSRLDLGTSGVLPFTTSRDVNGRVAAEIEAGQAERVYVAAVALGRRARLQGSGKLEHRLESDKRRARVVTSGGDLALAHYRVLSEQGGRALLELRPQTGRMHQLRVQLAAMDAPIAGDDLYGGAQAWRLLLHCRARTVLGERFEAPVPEEFSRWVATGSSFAPIASSFRARIADAAVLRTPLCASGDVFRVVNDQGDGLAGVTLDRYGDFAVLGLSSPEADDAAPAIGQYLRERGVLGVYVKRRERRDLRRAEAPELAPATPLTGDTAESPLAVHEGKLTILTELGDGLSTGLFVDQRDNRARLTELSADKQVLNLFSYTCSFSVAAALGGAARVTSVDLSGRALERGKLNFAASGLDAERHEFVQTDALRFVRGALKHGRRFDVIVLDPPSFATVGKATFRFERDIGGLMADCLRLLGSEGTLLCVTNHKQTSLAQFRRLLQNAAVQARREVKIKDLPSGLDCPDAPFGPHPSKSLLAQVVVSTERSQR
jgi:23S rRNA (cytosine1962-C5)-methyltransferase